jgi:hypothetical protein
MNITNNIFIDSAIAAKLMISKFYLKQLKKFHKVKLKASMANRGLVKTGKGKMKKPITLCLNV